MTNFDPRNHPSNAGAFSEKNHSAPETTLATPLSSQHPSVIDTQLAVIIKRLDAAQRDVQSIERQIDSHADGLRKKAAGDSAYRAFTDEGLNLLYDKLHVAQDRVSTIRHECEPFEEEFARRRGWTRAFLVNNTGGHVHRNRHCSTCYPTTSYLWLPQYSGRPEDEIVSDAGEKACTVCYPSAPAEVLSRPSKIEDPEAVAAREGREQAKAARAAKFEVKGIWNPDGTELREVSDRWAGQVIKTERTAEIMAVDHLVSLSWAATRDYQKTQTAYHQAKQETFDRIIVALAHKRGQTAEETLEFITSKAAAKFRKQQN